MSSVGTPSHLSRKLNPNSRMAGTAWGHNSGVLATAATRANAK